MTAEAVGVAQAWDAIASRFDEFATPVTVPLGDELVRRLDVGPGTRFLDVAAGSGGLALPAARRRAEVLAVDIAPIMVERLRARAAAEGLTNLDVTIMDGCALELPDALFDVAASLNGVSLFPDLHRGVGELMRVTRPGGRVMVAAFGPPQHAEFLGFFLAALQATVPGFTGPPTAPPPLPFQLADPERMHGVLTGAGLCQVAVDTIIWSMEFRSGRHMWDVVSSSNPIGAALVADLTDGQRAEVQRVLHGMLRDRSGGGPGATLHTELNVGTGTKRNVGPTAGDARSAS